MFPIMPLLLGGGISMTYVGSTSSTANATSYTFSAHSLGAVTADRTIVVVVCMRDDGSATPNMVSCTVAGNAATLVIENGTAANCLAIYRIQDATNATGDIVITNTDTCEKAAIAVYTISGHASATPTDSDENVTAAGPESLTALTVTAGGVYVIGAMSQAPPGPSWSGVSTAYDFEIDVESTTPFSCQHGSSAATITNAFTVNWDGSTITMVGATWL